MKPFWKSRTLWVNVLSGAALVLNHGELVPIDGDMAALALAGVNIALRLVTKTGVTASTPKPPAAEPAGV